MVLPMDLLATDKHSSLVQKVVERFKKVSHVNLSNLLPDHHSLFFQIDYLVNNAGRSQRAEAIATDLAVDRACIELNTLSTISLTKAVLPGMVECREGCVVTISSVAGKMGIIVQPRWEETRV